MKAISIKQLELFVELDGSVMTFAGTDTISVRFQNEFLASFWFDTLVELIDSLREFTKY